MPAETDPLFLFQCPWLARFASYYWTRPAFIGERKRGRPPGNRELGTGLNHAGPAPAQASWPAGATTQPAQPARVVTGLQKDRAGLGLGRWDERLEAALGAFGGAGERGKKRQISAVAQDVRGGNRAPAMVGHTSKGTDGWAIQGRDAMRCDRLPIQSHFSSYFFSSALSGASKLGYEGNKLVVGCATIRYATATNSPSAQGSLNQGALACCLAVPRLCLARRRTSSCTSKWTALYHTGGIYIWSSGPSLSTRSFLSPPLCSLSSTPSSGPSLSVCIIETKLSASRLAACLCLIKGFGGQRCLRQGRKTPEISDHLTSFHLTSHRSPPRASAPSELLNTRPCSPILNSILHFDWTLSRARVLTFFYHYSNTLRAILAKLCRLRLQ